MNPESPVKAKPPVVDGGKIMDVEEGGSMSESDIITLLLLSMSLSGLDF